MRIRSAAVVLAAAAVTLPGCGGGGSSSSSSTAAITPQAATRAAVSRAISGGGIAQIFSRFSTAFATANRSRAALTRARDTQVLDDGTIITTTYGAATTQGTVTSVPFSGTVTLPNNGGTISMSGTAAVDNRGTPNDSTDDVLALNSTISGSITEEGMTLSTTGTIVLSASATSATMTLSLNVSSGGETLALSEKATITGDNSSSVELTVVSGGYTTTLKTATDPAGATTMTLGDSTGVQMVVNLNAQGVGTGTVTMNGQKVADVAVASDGYMTVTYTDGSSDPPIYLGGLA